MNTTETNRISATPVAAPTVVLTTVVSLCLWLTPMKLTAQANTSNGQSQVQGSGQTQQDDAAPLERTEWSKARKASYAKAVDAMKALDSDPKCTKEKPDPICHTSWSFQNSIHAGLCQHGGWQFLPWHRAYLYWFEQIIRDKSGDPKLTLPYWNYTKGGADDRKLPAEFRDNKSPLWDPARRKAINDGDPMPASAVKFDVAWVSKDFVGEPPDGFGGGRIRHHGIVGGEKGAIEAQPHDPVHNAVGGDMGSNAKAANDAIFWLHHAEIDRLWYCWIKVQGRKNPPNNVAVNAPWYGQTYTFYDAKGAEQPLKGDKVDDISKLGYTYDNCPPKSKLPGSEEELVQLAMQESSETAVAEESPKTLASSKGAGVRLAVEPVRMTIDLSGEAQDDIEAAAKNPQQSVVLRFDDVAADQPPRAYYEVYINLPDTAQPDSNSRYYAGNLAMFGIGEPSMEMADHTMPSAHRIIPLTNAVRALMTSGEWDRSQMSVTFVMPLKLDAQEASDLTKARPRFGTMSIVLMSRGSDK